MSHSSTLISLRQRAELRAARIELLPPPDGMKVVVNPMTVTAPAETPAQRRPLIYIVDDEPMVLEVVSRCLEKAGYPTKAFANPVVAYSAFALADPKPDLLIVDYAMPEMDGLELLRRCRGLAPRLKALSISGTLTSDMVRETEVKPDGFLRKPFTNGELLALVQLLVG
ncbi:MAG: response regulator [Limisphaerales bacterium]